MNDDMDDEKESGLLIVMLILWVCRNSSRYIFSILHECFWMDMLWHMDKLINIRRKFYEIRIVWKFKTIFRSL